MPIILSHTSALERLRSAPPSCEEAFPVEGRFDLSGIKPSKCELAHFDPKELGLFSSPIHILGSKRETQSKSQLLHVHRTSMPLLPGELLRIIGPDQYASGPELAFLQMASMKSLLELIVLGFELCGSYSHFAPFVSGFYERTPLTSVQRIKDALDHLRGHHGIKRARKALDFVLDGCASPMETVLACMLTLPNDMGGEGFAPPIPNKEVILDEIARRITGTRTCRVDLAWEDNRIGFEYFGGPFHTDEAKDRLRREALSHEKWTIFTADISRISSYSRYSALLGLIKETIPRKSGMKEPENYASKDLFRKLMAATRSGLGVDAALFAPFVSARGVKLHLGSSYV